MSDLDPRVENRLNRLSEQIRVLGYRMDELTAQLLARSPGPQAIPAASAFLGRRARAPLLVCFGILGASFTGTALDFPDPFFPGLMALLFLANVATYTCARTQRCSWIKWVLLLLTLFIWLVWALKAHFAFSRGIGATLAGGLPWLLPELAAFVCAALFLIIAAVLRGDGTVGVIVMFGQILIVAAAVALIGAAKVFLYDFSRLHGLPAVINVSSFAVTTALGALLWARWQRRASQDKPEEPE